jgi:hypothetical protein
MPFVRNGYLRVERSDGGFMLSHPSAIFAYDEQRDIIATELSLSAMERQFPLHTEPLSRMIDDRPHLRGDDLLIVLRGAYVFYLGGVSEDEFIANSGYQRAFRFERADFLRVRAALMARWDRGVLGWRPRLRLSRCRRMSVMKKSGVTNAWNGAVPLLCANVMGVPPALPGWQ